MIIKQQNYSVESSGLLSEKLFGVQDLGMIFDILRSKLYSNPILAVCREISCNARDSHREAGIPDEPIIISLPSLLDPNYKIKDVGVGISPDRAENVFVNYTASTKRNDNTQTGAFGLGAKSCFATTSDYAVITIYDQVKYHYSCYIDASRVGKMALLSKSRTHEHNGTEIIVPAQPSDFNLFRQYTEQACQHWTVKPIIHGGKPIEWKTPDKIIEGKNWAIVKSGGYSSEAQLIIDGIEYPLNQEALSKYADPKLIDAARGTLVMYFGIGELSLSANREQIYLDKPTQDVIKTRLDQITKGLKQLVLDKIESFTDLYQANIYYRKTLNHAFSDLSFFGKLEWQGIALTDGWCDVKCGLYDFQRGGSSGYRAKDTSKCYKSIGRHITFEENYQLFINDLGIANLTPKHVKKLFDADPKLQCVQVICPNDTQDEQALNSTIHLDLMQPRRLSEITKNNTPGKVYTPPGQRLLIFKFASSNYYDIGSSGFRLSSHEVFKTDSKSKVLCLLSKDIYTPERYAHLSNGKKLNYANLKYLQDQFSNVSFYGVDQEIKPTRITKEFKGCQSLNDFLSQHITKQHNITEIKYAIEHAGDIDSHLVSYGGKLTTLIKQDNMFVRRIELHQKISKLAGKAEQNLMDLYQAVHGDIDQVQLDKFIKQYPAWNLNKINQECNDRYPLLKHINSYYWSEKQTLQDIADYINLIDAS